MNIYIVEHDEDIDRAAIAQADLAISMRFPPSRASQRSRTYARKGVVLKAQGIAASYNQEVTVTFNRRKIDGSPR